MTSRDPHSTCSEVLTSLSVYLDHELDHPEQVEAITVHLQQCQPCQQQSLVEQRLHQMLAQSCANEPVPAELRQRVIERLTELRLEMTREEDFNR